MTHCVRLTETPIPHTKSVLPCSLSIPIPRPTEISSSLAEGLLSSQIQLFGELTCLRLIAEKRLRSTNGDMWQLYISQGEKHDPQLAKHWKGQTDTILNFVRTESFLVMGNFFTRSH